MLCTLRQIFRHNFQILSRSNSKFFNLVDLILTLTGVLDEFEKMKIDIKFIETDCSRHWAIQQWSDGTEDTGVDLGETFTWVEWWSGFVAGWFVGLDLFTLIHGLKTILIFQLDMVNQGSPNSEKLPWGIEPSIVLVGCKHLIFQDRRQLPWHVPWLDHRYW